MQQKKNNKNKIIKEEVKEENSNKKLIIIALILALLIAVAAYFKVASENKNKDDKVKNNSKIEDKINKDDLQPLETEDNTTTKNNSYVVKSVSSNEEKNEVEEDEEIYYSLSFESNGGSSVEKQILGKNEVTKLEYSTREGWVFAGWFEDADLTNEYIFETHLTEDKTVYAKWVKYVKYMYDNEVLENTAEVALNDEIPLLTSEDLGNELEQDMELGWFVTYEDEDSNLVTTEILSGDVLTEELANKFDDEIVLKANFLSKFVMNFNYYVETPQEDENSSEEEFTLESIQKTVVEGRKIPFNEVENEIRNKYPEFSDKEFGWYYWESQMKFNLDKDSKANKNIVDVYMGEVVTITYYERVETEDDNSQDQLLKEEKVIKDSHIKEEDILKPEEKEGYVFDGWYTDEDDSKKLTPELEIYDDTKFIGKWVEEEENPQITATEVSLENEQVTEEDLSNYEAKEEEPIEDNNQVNIDTDTDNENTEAE